LGRQNLPTTDPTWCHNVFIGDMIQILDYREGIIGFRTPFDHTAPVIPGSEDWGWTAQVRVHGVIYKAYLTAEPLPQVALDVLLVIKSNGKLWVKLLRRGSDPNTVDFPNVLMSGAGEHLEPGTSTPKEDIVRAIGEEIGLELSELPKAQIVELGKFSDPDRDPRYTIFKGFDEETGKPVEFGMRRGSTTTLKMIYIEYPDDINTQPEEIPHTDITEIAYSFWMGLDQAIGLSPKDFILEENHSYLQIAKNWIESNRKN
jgi:ADP-ribose pyrophosphatase YjhB (NUDIX family)